ncbi:hypothetical protein GS534_24275 [Rhodococcus hoagii]|nr:hypothetical protein [Prescottella equi]NKS33147.1 hypothetical protein [Prescottella equi]
MKNKQRLWPYILLAVVSAAVLGVTGVAALTVGDSGVSTIDNAPFDVWGGE